MFSCMSTVYDVSFLYFFSFPSFNVRVNVSVAGNCEAKCCVAYEASYWSRGTQRLDQPLSSLNLV